MKLIFAQGNPGHEYATTRHNVGWLIADVFASKHGVEFMNRPKFSASIAELTLGDEKVFLVRPTTYYNETGNSLRAIVDFYKIAPEDTIIIHDDLALPFGTLRTRFGGSGGGNNGIKSINAHGGEETARLRIGVSNELRAHMDDVSFVLGKFSNTEHEILEKDIFPTSIQFIEEFVRGEFTPHSVTLDAE